MSAWECDGRPARRTQWLVSALASNFGLGGGGGGGVENEVVVLATGLDQYLQEVFHHLDGDGQGRLPREDFRALCRVLGLRDGADEEDEGEEENDEEEEEEEGRWPVPPQLTFREFTLVGLWKTHASHKKNGTCFIGSRRELTNLQSQTSKCLQSVLKEVELLRSSRDEQIEEAIRFNQELEKELRNSHEAVVALEDCNRILKREQAEMRKKVEEARHAVLNSLGKVKELEDKAHKVPQLQTYIQQLESQLQYYR
uniref:EF-hand domain-containing protein n=1 Tax=Anolis carolinensis TaxID=28377 RepID=G1KN93_ANOCA